MHRLRDQTSVNRLRLAAWLALVVAFTGAAIAGLLAYSMIVEAPHPAYVALALVGFLVVFILAQIFCASHARCPICLVTPLAPHLCTKNRRVGTLLGSHRLRVAASVVNHGVFQCPYCGEMTRVEARGGVPQGVSTSGGHTLIRSLQAQSANPAEKGPATRFRGFSKCQPRRAVDEVEP